MDHSARTADDRAYASPGAARALDIAVAAALAVGVVWRLTGWSRPLWFDETFTGAIALQPRYSGLVHDCLNEVNGPVYYHLMWLWVKVAGASNVALRLPSLAFSLAAPALILWRGHPDRIVRAVWAAQAALLYVLISYSNEARSYSFQFLMASVQVMLFAAAIRRPAPGPAYGWAAVSVLLVLTHYFTLPITGLQGLCLTALAWRSRDMRRCWPALLLFAPMLAWMAVHLPLLGRVAGVIDWPTLTWADLVPSIIGMIGYGRPVILLYSVLLAAMTIGFAYDARGRVRSIVPPYGIGDVLVILTGLGALLTIIVYGVLHPSFRPRYIVPTLPALMLAPAIWARSVARFWAPAPAVLIGLVALVGGVRTIREWGSIETGQRSEMQWQKSSDRLIGAGVRTVAFLWDDRQTAISSPELLRRVEGFFFDRVGSGIRTLPMISPIHGPLPDPNLVLPAMLDAAGNRGRGGFVWAIFQKKGSLYSRYPLRMDALASRFVCEVSISTHDSKVLTCIERR